MAIFEAESWLISEGKHQGTRARNASLVQVGE